MSLLTDDVRALIGRSVTFTAPEPVGRASIRYFAAAVGDDNPAYPDVAPPTFVCETNQFVAGQVPVDEHGYPGFTWAVPVPGGARLVRGGNTYTFHRPLRPDDVVTVTHTVVDVVERTASSGADMLVLTNEITYSAADGGPIATNVETFIWTTS